jgi:hypothetical protein
VPQQLEAELMNGFFTADATATNEQMEINYYARVTVFNSCVEKFVENES